MICQIKSLVKNNTKFIIIDSQIGNLKFIKIIRNLMNLIFIKMSNLQNFINSNKSILIFNLFMQNLTNFNKFQVRQFSKVFDEF